MLKDKIEQVILYILDNQARTCAFKSSELVEEAKTAILKAIDEDKPKPTQDEMTPMEKMCKRIVKIDFSKPLKKECEHEWIMISQPFPIVCRKCGKERIPEPAEIKPNPEPKPERIELLTGGCEDIAEEITEARNKINEIINHLTRGKG